jgi:hypothetical protein
MNDLNPFSKRSWRKKIWMDNERDRREEPVTLGQFFLYVIFIGLIVKLILYWLGIK